MSKRPSAYHWALAGILGIAVLGSTIALSRRDYSFFDPLIDIKTILGQRYVEPPDEKAMQDAAIDAMISSLHDPYTAYIPPAERRQFDKELTGDFVGIGVQVVVIDGWLTVVSPLEDTPAFRAGIIAEDRIIEIEGKPTFGRSPDECVALLAGEPGAPLTLTIERKGRRLPVTIVRDRIVTRTVKGLHWIAADTGAQGAWQYMLDPGRRIAYLRLTQFTPTSAAELADALSTVGASRTEPDRKLGGLILDLRWNPGGLLNAAVEMADLFLKDGVIVTAKGRVHKDDVYRATEPGTLPDFPMVVLVNGQSASASEVLSGALSEQDRAIVVGTRSFGKGLVQSILSLPSVPGAQLRLTEQRYYLPSGRSLHRLEDSSEWGVDPTPGFYVPLSDEQVGALLTVRRQEEVIHAGPAEDGQRGGANAPQPPAPSEGGRAQPAESWSDPDWIIEHLKDPQLAAAAAAMRARIDRGEWERTGRDLPAGSAVARGDLQRAHQLRERLFREMARIDKRIESLEKAAATSEVTPLNDLWPDGTNLLGGHVVITDKSGQPVTRLKITGGGLERWLMDAELEKEPPAESVGRDDPAKPPAADPGPP